MRFSRGKPRGRGYASSALSGRQEDPGAPPRHLREREQAGLRLVPPCRCAVGPKAAALLFKVYLRGGVRPAASSRPEPSGQHWPPRAAPPGAGSGTGAGTAGHEPAPTRDGGVAGSRRVLPGP